MYINDPYLSDMKCIERLYNEYQKHNSLIVAFDFDGTVNDFHGEGFTFKDIIGLLHEAKKLNCFLYVFTAHPDEQFVRNYLVENQIPFDAINDSPVKEGMGNKKPYYNILLDDRAGLSASYNQLKQVLKRIKNELV